MNNRNAVLILWIGLAFLSPTYICVGQTNYLKNLQFRAQDFFNAELYLRALADYRILDSLQPNEANIKYKIGLCILQSSTKSKALPWLLEAQKLGLQASGMWFNVGKAYHYNSEFALAIASLEKAKILLPDSLTTNKERYNQVLKLLQHCKNGLALKQVSQQVTIINLGANINSQYAEYSPLLTADESCIIFTSCRPANVGKALDPKTGGYYEDLWIASKNKTNEWEVSKNMQTPINTPTHDASGALSADGQTLIIYRNENLYISKLKGTLWSVPILLPKSINSEAWESSASISADGNHLYFSSNKKGGFGGKDLYVSHRLANTNWGTATNLGKVINSKYDEEAPYIHSNQNTLYFSSDRAESIGGFDIFYSDKDSLAQWNTPENIGFPINSPEDDLDFVWSADGKRGYFSSTREGGFGEEDLYQIDRKVPPSPLLLLSGLVTNNSGMGLDAKLVITDLDLGNLAIETNTNNASGKYTVLLKPGKNYGVQLLAPNYLPFSETISLEEAISNEYTEIKKDFVLQRLQIGNSSILQNVFFDTDKYELRPNSYLELNALVLFLKQNKLLHLRIGGHTDNVGDEAHNLKLAQNRANSVVTYLVNKGIATQRLSTISLGSSKPIAANENETGRQKNRRIEIEVVQ